MHSVFQSSYHAEAEGLIHAHAPRFSLKNSFLKVQALPRMAVWTLFAILVLIYCLSVTAVFYLFNFSLMNSEFNVVITLLLFAMFALMIFSCLVAFFAGYVIQQMQQPAVINALNSQPADFTGEQAIAIATSSMRQQISLDLHDGAIQPYIGLKLGLEALRRKIHKNDALAIQVDDLISMTAESIAELRHYSSGLKSKIKSQLEKPLVPAILEMAKKYQHRHGIEVIVNADPEFIVSERLATEVYQLVREGLSNIHRHTAAKEAEIKLFYQHDQLVIEFINQVDNAQDFIHFKPRSMTERVNYLGGTIGVNHIAADKMTEARTIVTAKIPLKLKDRRNVSYT